MAASSTLLSLYVAAYGKPPSAHTETALVRMEQLLGVEQDDPFARAMVVLFHAADRFDEAVGRRTEEERGFLDELTGLMRGLTFLIRQIEETGVSVARRKRATRHLLDDDALVPAHRSVSPLFAYLAHAFRRRTGVLEEDERIGAARSDLFGTGTLLIVALVLATGAGRLLG